MMRTTGLCTLLAIVGLGSAQAASIKDCEDCPEMVVIPAGSFTMGAAGQPKTSPPHAVALRSFAIGRHEVTQGQWQAVMGANPSRFAECGPECPVENISWHDAREFARRLSARTGKTYRLPSEAEWEYACRAGGGNDFCGGDSAEPVAWYGNEYGNPHPVGRKQANAWGLHDMSGNVWEWTQDCSHASYAGAPADGSAWETGECASRILRGGSWLSGPQYSRATLRFGFKPGFRAGDFGLRVVRDVE
ncbi:MAG: formylglycine-generating enzyme family protein [Sterolibacteriaceae bacterium MAG5]|nr:formylglycine-generating enzyme family protein [Candidatus Nitricoxidireducens bremensis]